MRSVMAIINLIITIVINIIIKIAIIHTNYYSTAWVSHPTNFSYFEGYSPLKASNKT